MRESNACSFHTHEEKEGNMHQNPGSEKRETSGKVTAILRSVSELTPHSNSRASRETDENRRRTDTGLRNTRTRYACLSGEGCRSTPFPCLTKKAAARDSRVTAVLVSLVLQLMPCCGRNRKEKESAFHQSTRMRGTREEVVDVRRANERQAKQRRK